MRGHGVLQWSVVTCATAVVIAGTQLAGSQDRPTGPARPAAFSESFAGPIEKAHGISAWRSAAALECELAVDFGGRRALEGKMLLETGSGRVRMDLVGGTVLVFDGAEAWVAPASALSPRSRFDALTWSYFLAAPMKLRDPGTRLEELGALPLRDGEAAPAAKLTFGPGVGDTPEDWYILYRQPGTDLLRAMAYIVTYGKKRDAAEKEPHAILYDGFAPVGGAQISTQWTFWNWSREKGLVGEPLGRAEIKSPRLVTPAADAFARPVGSARAEMPAAP